MKYPTKQSIYRLCCSALVIMVVLTSVSCTTKKKEKTLLSDNSWLKGPRQIDPEILQAAKNKQAASETEPSIAQDTDVQTTHPDTDTDQIAKLDTEEGIRLSTEPPSVKDKQPAHTKPFPNARPSEEDVAKAQNLPHTAQKDIGTASAADLNKSKDPPKTVKTLPDIKRFNPTAPEKIEPDKERKNPKVDLKINPALLGKWRQVEGGFGADFVEGGYSSSVIEFKPSGMLSIYRSFGKEQHFTLVREADFKWQEDETLLIGDKAPFDDEILISEEITVATEVVGEEVRLIPAKKKLPIELVIVLKGDSLTLGEKKYERIREDEEKDGDEHPSN